MLNQPMSSPMMNRMLGFFPAAPGCPWPPPLASAWASRLFRSQPSEQHGAGEALFGLLSFASDPVRAASAGGFSHRWPDAAAYPSSAPAARNTTARNLVLRNMAPPSLQNREQLPSGRSESPLLHGGGEGKKNRT